MKQLEVLNRECITLWSWCELIASRFKCPRSDIMLKRASSRETVFIFNFVHFPVLDFVLIRLHAASAVWSAAINATSRK